MMARTPKAHRRGRGMSRMARPPRPVWGVERYRVGGDDALDRWFAKRLCDGTCYRREGPGTICATLNRLHRMRRAYARRRHG